MDEGHSGMHQHARTDDRTVRTPSTMAPAAAPPLPRPAPAPGDPSLGETLDAAVALWMVNAVRHR